MTRETAIQEAREFYTEKHNGKTPEQSTVHEEYVSPVVAVQLMADFHLKMVEEEKKPEPKPCDHPFLDLHPYHDMSVICHKCNEVIWQVKFDKKTELEQWQSKDNPLNQ